MGREATCQCQWAQQAASCKVLLETHELIVRGSIRRSVPIASLRQISVRGDDLLFRAGEDDVTLNLGSTLAQSWAKKLTAPPPTLAAKLGISSATYLALIGDFETIGSEDLKTAIAAAALTDGKDADLILASIKTSADLNYTLDRYSIYASDPPIWLIYRKGPNKPLTETEIRSTLRHEGFIDTKVASVSQTLTALRFIKRA
jgi:hypothetical protein